MASPSNNNAGPQQGGKSRTAQVFADATKESDKLKKNVADIEKSMDRIFKQWSKVQTGALGRIGGSGGNGKLGGDVDASIRSIQSRMDEMYPKSPTTGKDIALGAGRFAASAAGFAYGMMPNTLDAVAQRISAQGVASITGQTAQQVIRQSNAAIGGGMTGPYSAQNATAILGSAGILPTMGSYRNIMGQVGGYSALTGMSNEQVAAGFGSMNGMNMLRLGVRARNPDGSLRDPSQISSDLYRRMYGNRKITAEQAAQVFNPNSRAYRNVMAAAGGNQELFQSMATNMVFQAKNGGKALDMSDPKNVMDNILKLPKDDPMRALFKYQTSEARKLQGAGNGLVGGYSGALNATADVNNAFSRLAETAPAVADAFGKLKGFLDTLPLAGNTGATLAGGLGNFASNIAGNLQSKLQERATNKILSEFGLGNEGGGGGGGGGPMIFGRGGSLANSPIGQGAKMLGTSGSRMAGLRMLAGTSTARFVGGAAVIGAANFAIPKLRRYVSGHTGIAAGSTADVLGTTAAYAGSYAAGGAMLGTIVPGVGNAVGAGVGAVLGTGVGLYKGWQASHQAPNTGGDMGAGHARPSNTKGTTGTANTSGVFKPANGRITADYGQKPKNNSYWQWKGYHTGRDFGVGSGSSVKSYKSGVVTEIGHGGAYGNSITVDHGGYQSFYAHLSSVGVKRGQKVSGGTQIGLSGQTGSGAAQGPHLHFEIRKGKDNPIDPRPYLGGASTVSSAISIVKNAVNKVADAVTGGANKIANWFSGDDNEKDTAFTRTSYQAAAHSAFTTNRGGFTGNKDTSTEGLLGASGGDMGAASVGSSSSGSGGNVTINMNVRIANANTASAVQLAKEIKTILEKDLRNSKVGSF